MKGKFFLQFLHNASIVLLKRVEDVALPIFLGTVTLTLCFLGKTSTEAFKTLELSPGFQVAAACQLTGQT